MKICAFDIETEPFNAKAKLHFRNVPFVCGAIAWLDDNGQVQTEYFVDPFAMGKRLEAFDVLCAHNAIFDVGVLERARVPINTAKVYCTMLMAWLLNENDSIALASCSLRDLQEEKIDFFRMDGKPNPKSTLTKVYVKRDAELALKLALVFLKRLQDERLLKLYLNIDLPSLWLWWRATDTGLLINRTLLSQTVRTLSQECFDMERRLSVVGGEYINLRSPQQLWKVLYRFPEKVPVNKNGFPKTDKTTIKNLPPHILSHRGKEILVYRKKVDLLTKYYRKFLWSVEDDERTHPLYNLTRAVTGRLSSGSSKAMPHGINIQNVPKEGADQAEKDTGYPSLREMVIAPPGQVFAAWDASQVEFRVLAHYAQDPTLTKAFLENLDLHTLTAAKLFRKAPEDVTESERAVGKTINFAIIYGTTKYGLAFNLKIPEEEAEGYLQEFWRGTPGAVRLKSWVHNCLLKQGFVTSMFGRRRRIPEYKEASRWQQERHLREAMSGLIQGTAADLLKGKAVLVAKMLRPPVEQFLTQVHDEFGSQLLEEGAERRCDEIRVALEQAGPQLRVPILFDCGIGKNWLIAKKTKVERFPQAAFSLEL